ncbi:SDR family oxidoreductase [Hirschia litorea]|uniref:SDR family oxidoreductase n=1 Tax=Hirschia litorea TaxID=1199156 RepID=A0ABW2IMW5_9PROT
MTVKSLMCFGYGYTAKSLARNVSISNWEIIGTNRTPETKFCPENKTVRLTPWPAPDFTLNRPDAVLISVPPTDTGCPVYAQFKDHFAPETWIGYLSSTGVYGDLGGGWAFEETPINPLSEEAKKRAIAETQWQDLGAHIFRLPGIYGPGRSTFDRLRTGKSRRIIREGQIFSRAHVEDIADILARSIAKPNRGRIYNVADDLPSPPQDIITYGAHLLGIEPPPKVLIEDANLPQKAQRFYTECKRISNARIKSELGWLPKYPSYKQGLPAILEAEQSENRV